MNERQSDFDLLQAFVRQGEQAAFAQVVQRHLDLVYATAFRKLQEAGAAQEVAQNVFTALARKAWQFAPDDSLPAWLYKTTLLAAKEWLRGELRRRRREQTAAELGTTMKTPDDQPALSAMVPLLDEALLSLREKERTALLLRFYENQSLRDVGAALGVGEDAAQKRVASGLGKLAAFFQRRGYKTATAAAVAAALECTATSAPAAVGNAVVLAAGQMTPPTLLGLAALGARLASWSKAQTAAVCLALAAVPVAWQWQEQHQAREQAVRSQTELGLVQTELSTVQTRIDRLNETAVRLAAAPPAPTPSTDSQEEARQKYEAWKNHLRSRLLAADYRWPEDSPFVRIPKSALCQLSVLHAVEPPGVLKPAARELLGLTPREREQFEGALQSHIAAIDNLIEASITVTDKLAHIRLPATALASHGWFISPLGDRAKAQGDEIQAAMQEILGNERWPMVKELLEASGSSSLRRALSLDASQDSQEFGVWILQTDGKPTVGYGWSGSNSSFSFSGLALDLFKPGAPADAEGAAEFTSGHDLPEGLTKRIMEWIRQQAAQRLGKDTNR